MKNAKFAKVLNQLKVFAFFAKNFAPFAVNKIKYNG